MVLHYDRMFTSGWYQFWCNSLIYNNWHICSCWDTQENYAARNVTLSDSIGVHSTRGARLSSAQSNDLRVTDTQEWIDPQWSSNICILFRKLRGSDAHRKKNVKQREQGTGLQQNDEFTTCFYRDQIGKTQMLWREKFTQVGEHAEV